MTGHIESKKDKNAYRVEVGISKERKTRNLSLDDIIINLKRSLSYRIENQM